MTIFHAPLSSTDAFDIDWVVDGTALGSGTTNEIEKGADSRVNDASQTILRNNQSGLTNNFPKGWRHKFRLERTDGSTLRIEAIKLRFRSVEQE